MNEDDHRGEQQPMTDEEALTAMFASLVEDSPASEVSPDRVIQLAGGEQDAALERRIKRLKLGRNFLLVAVLAGFVAIVVPKIGHSSSESSAPSSSSAAAPAAAPVPAASAAGSAAASAASAPAAAASVPAAAPGAPASGSAASDGPTPGGSSPAGTSAQAAESAAAAPASGAASAAAGGGLPSPTAASSSGCSLLPPKAVLAVRAQFPAGYFGPATLPAECTGLYGATMESRAPNRGPLHIDVTRAGAGSCREAVPACTPLAGARGAYQQATPGLGSPVYVYGNGYQVEALRRRHSSARA